MELLKLTDVFASGTFPELNYIVRGSKYEDKIIEYLEIDKGKCLTIHGPSKSGKTVTVQKVLEQSHAIWLKGQNIKSIEEFYKLVSDQLEQFVETTSSESTNIGGSAGINLGFVRFNLQGSKGNTSGVKRQVSDLASVENELKEKPVPIVIDDFHFIPPDLQREITLAVKSLITLTSVIIITIPEISLVEIKKISDMDSRVVSIKVTHWDIEELKGIGAKGFELLNVGGLEQAVEQFAKHSYGSPLLMQSMCKLYCYRNLSIRQSFEEYKIFDNPSPEKEFFSNLANENKPEIFEKLLKGKNSRGKKRKNKTFEFNNNFYNSDVYSYVLLELHYTNVSSTSDILTLDEIYESLREKQRVDKIPDEKTLKSQDISKCLKSMSEIAEEKKGDSDPALIYREQKLQIIDPNLINYIINSNWVDDKFIQKGEYMLRR